MIPIRFAEKGDIPRLVEMGMAFLASTPRYKDMVPGDPEALAGLYGQIMEHDNSVFFVLGERGDAFGMLAATFGISPHSSLPTVAELFWWVTPGRRSFATGKLLLRGLFEWTRSTGATRLEMTSPSKKVSRLYRLLGFQKLEERFIMKVA